MIWSLLADLGSSLWRGAVIAAKWVMAVSLSEKERLQTVNGEVEWEASLF